MLSLLVPWRCSPLEMAENKVVLPKTNGWNLKIFQDRNLLFSRVPFSGSMLVFFFFLMGFTGVKYFTLLFFRSYIFHSAFITN